MRRTGCLAWHGHIRIYNSNAGNGIDTQMLSGPLSKNMGFLQARHEYSVLVFLSGGDPKGTNSKDLLHMQKRMDSFLYKLELER